MNTRQKLQVIHLKKTILVQGHLSLVSIMVTALDTETVTILLHVMC